MGLVESALFLGFPVEASFSTALEKRPPEYLALFINSGGAYLEEIYFQGVRYIGKNVNNAEPLTQLELLEAHIYSLLKKLVEDYDYSQSKLVLFALPHQSSSLTS